MLPSHLKEAVATRLVYSGYFIMDNKVYCGYSEQ